jgi:S-DNA-T family DNA segregation ATPase FtsK/SpoIIIE
MSKETPSRPAASPLPTELKGLFCLALTALFALSLLSFHAEESASNWLGLIGWGLGFGLSYLFGLASYLVVACMGWAGWRLVRGKDLKGLTPKVLYASASLLCICVLLNLIAEHADFLASLCSSKVYTESHFSDFPYPHRVTRCNLGGVPFYYLYKDLPNLNLERLLSNFGVGLTFSITLIVCFFLLTEMAPSRLLAALKKSFSLLNTPKREPVAPLDKKSLGEIEETLAHHTPLYSPGTLPKEKKPPAVEPVLSKKQEAIRAQKVINGDFTTYVLPPPTLLNLPKKVDTPLLKKELKRQAEILEETLLSFGIEAKVGEINCGPTITSFEVHPAVGVKVQKIKALENDIALNLQAKSIRIIAPIPGKAAVGVEIPSLYPQEVSFKELLVSYQQGSRKMQVPILLGKTVSGDNVISDLTKMPHGLIAGATGSGKSVCINTLIMSILMTARPDEVKLLMVDPKKVELTPYTSLPHMIAPVITEAHGAYAALSWLVKEMELRYELLKQLGLRNIAAFNHRAINKELEASLSIPVPEQMPFIVAIIDEFADLMMASSSDLETPIARIAQMARAVGIHLILATQRPSREVITGLIKANFPTRIAFKVASRINSQIILDDVGAENLLGNGDMLFLPPGSSALIRSQGAYISDEEINKVITFICDQAPARYLIKSFDRMQDGAESSLEGENPRDSLYDQARTLVIEVQTASTTFLQRKLKIGYARAASLMDELEIKGVIGPQEGAKPRRILQGAKQQTASSKPETADDVQELFE